MEHFERVMIPGPAGNPIPLVGLLFGAFKEGFRAGGMDAERELEIIKAGGEPAYLEKRFREWMGEGG